MKLHCSIQPRGDGTVLVEGFGKPIEFTADADGFLSADVANQETVAVLLGTGDFYPADPADYDQAVALSKSSTGGDNSSDLEDEVSDPNAPPLEANTPPKI